MVYVANKVALVTGGAGGIGFAIIKHLLENGAKGVGIVDSSKENGEAAEKTFKDEYGDKVIFIETDIRVEKELREAYEKTIDKFKNLDIVVNNAGLINESDWKVAIDVNLGAVMASTYLAIDKYLPEFRSSEDALVINTASIAAIDPLHNFYSYSATKCGVLGFNRSWGNQEVYDKLKVRVITICPGHTVTPMLMAAAPRYTDLPILDPDVPPAPAEGVGENAVWVMNEGKHGSVWVLENSERYEVVFPDRFEMRRK